MKRWEYVWIKGLNSDDATELGRKGWRVVPARMHNDALLFERELIDEEEIEMS